MGSERGVACSNMVSRKANMKKRGPGRMAPGKFLRKGGIREKQDNSAFGS